MLISGDPVGPPESVRSLAGRTPRSRPPPRPAAGGGRGQPADARRVRRGGHEDALHRRRGDRRHRRPSVSKAARSARCASPSTGSSTRATSTEAISLGRRHAGAAGRARRRSRPDGARALRSAGSRWRWIAIRGQGMPDTLLVIARAPDGHVAGFLHLVPSFGPAAMSLERMRRLPDEPNGLMEFLVVRTIALLREREVRRAVAQLRRLRQVPARSRQPFPGVAGSAAAVRRPLVPDPAAAAIQRQVRAALAAALPGLPVGRGAATLCAGGAVGRGSGAETGASPTPTPAGRRQPRSLSTSDHSRARSTFQAIQKHRRRQR